MRQSREGSRSAVNAVDTNLIVRLVTNDEPAQAKRAIAVFKTGRVFIAKSVLLETEWVLRYSYGLDRAAIEKAFRNVLGLPNVSVEDPDQVAQALARFAAGLDFADAVHLASSGGARRFFTFDKNLVKSTKELAAPETRLA